MYTKTYYPIVKIAMKMSIVMQANTPTVERNRFMPHFISPPKSSSIGVQKNMYPIMATDSTKRDKKAIGAITVFDSGPARSCP